MEPLKGFKNNIDYRIIININKIVNTSTMEKRMYRIEILGKNDKGPWDIKRVEKGVYTESEKAERFGGLGNKIINLLKGQDHLYGIDYQGENGRIFEDSEEAVIEYIVNSHNKLINLLRQLDTLKIELKE